MLRFVCVVGLLFGCGGDDDDPADAAVGTVDSTPGAPDSSPMPDADPGFPCCKLLTGGGGAIGFFDCNDQPAADACNNSGDASGCIRSAGRDDECPL